MIEINSLTKNFGKKNVIDDLSVCFDKKVYGLLGPNGSGKTTLMRCLTLLYSDAQGQIKYNNSDVRKSKNYLNKIGYLPQQFGLFKELKVREMMLLMANYKGIDKQRAMPMVLKSINLVNLEDRLESKVGSLSGGMIRRLGIAQAILNDPDIIIFDEPTAGLDPEERLRFKNLISQIKEDKTIIISTHIVEDVEAVCDRIAIMKNKKITLSGTVMEIEQYANGKVFQLDEEELKKLNCDYFVQKNVEIQGKKEVRVLSNQIKDIEPVPPTVEDGYICIIKDI